MYLHLVVISLLPNSLFLSSLTLTFLKNPGELSWRSTTVGFVPLSAVFPVNQQLSEFRFEFFISTLPRGAVGVPG